MLEAFSTETLKAVFDALPVEVPFVDDADTVRYYSRGDKRIFKRTPAVIGSKVQDCHPKHRLCLRKRVMFLIIIGWTFICVSSVFVA